VPRAGGFAAGSIQCSREEITKISNSGDLILTTRIDNDDLMHKYYMRVIKKDAKMYAPYYRRLALNYTRGLSWDGRQLVNFVMQVPNMFVSLLEPFDDMKTVISYKHAEIGRGGYLKSLSNRIPMWMINVHGGNWANTHKKGIVLKNHQSIFADFGLQLR
jgi:hypothetical protein